VCLNSSSRPPSRGKIGEKKTHEGRKGGTKEEKEGQPIALGRPSHILPRRRRSKKETSKEKREKGNSSIKKKGTRKGMNQALYSLHLISEVGTRVKEKSP